MEYHLSLECDFPTNIELTRQAFPTEASPGTQASPEPSQVLPRTSDTMYDVLRDLETTGVDVKRFNTFFKRCWMCSMITRVQHDCEMPIIDLTED